MGMGLFRRRAPQDELPEGWRDTLAERIAHWCHLEPDEQERLGDLTGQLIASKNWEAAAGFELTDEMQLLIAAQAALLVLGLSFEHYREVGAIIVHPTTVVMTGPRGASVAGLMTDSPISILGQAAHKGPIIISWDAVKKDTRHPQRGHNVVFHEFAHKLDMLTNAADGTPPLAPEQFERWVQVCTREYELAQRASHGFLSTYAGVNPAEFFAVATEAFFDRPVAMREHMHDLYEVLAGFYRQDPATRVDRTC